jgi:hypothetical protein
MQVAYSVVAAKVKPNEIQIAIGFINVAQIGSIAIGLSISSSIFQNVGFIKLRDALEQFHLPDNELRAALGGAKSAIYASGQTQIQKLAVDAIVATISKVWILTITAGAVSLASGLFMKREKLELGQTAGG